MTVKKGANLFLQILYLQLVKMCTGASRQIINSVVILYVAPTLGKLYFTVEEILNLPFRNHLIALQIFHTICYNWYIIPAWELFKRFGSLIIVYFDNYTDSLFLYQNILNFNPRAGIKSHIAIFQFFLIICPQDNTESHKDLGNFKAFLTELFLSS